MDYFKEIISKNLNKKDFEIIDYFIQKADEDNLWECDSDEDSCDCYINSYFDTDEEEISLTKELVLDKNFYMYGYIYHLDIESKNSNQFKAFMFVKIQDLKGNAKYLKNSTRDEIEKAFKEFFNIKK
jgi:hypothetical protein